MRISTNARLLCGVAVIAFGIYDLLGLHSYLWGGIVECGGLLIVVGALLDRRPRDPKRLGPSGE